MSDIEIDIDPDFFNEHYLPILDDDSGVRVIFGGGGSGKSVFAAQNRALDMLMGDRNFLCVRKVAKTLQDSIYTETTKAINGMGPEIAKLFLFKLSPLKIICLPTRKTCLFLGLDDVEKVKSIAVEDGVITDVDVEEATETLESDIDQLMIRMRGISPVKKRLTLLLNPTDRQHWIAKKYFSGISDDVRLHRGQNLLISRTTYRDNKFLMPDDIERIESFKEKNPNFYKVYGLGQWGSLGNLIFKNWKIADLSQIAASFDIVYHGLDFGFAGHPSAYIRVGVKGDNIYILRELVAKGLGNRQLADAIRAMVGRDPVECDCAEPKSIAELRENGINAISALKGPDSIVFGIQWLQGKTIYVDQSCKTTSYELSVYEWMKDNNGESIAKPVDKNNHCLDALRYALARLMKGTIKIHGARL